MVQILDTQWATRALFDAAVPVENLHSSLLRLRHGLYPQGLLEREGFAEPQRNAIANLALTTKEVNSRIGNRKLHRFIEDEEEKGVLWDAQAHLDAHCIPRGAGTLPYEAFLAARAELMAARL